jgi:AcrR family transcriptional regulator
MTADADSTQTSRARLLESGKILFARFGFEQTSTAIIAKEAGTSESQLVRYYKTKAGLLEAIFNEGWGQLNGDIQRVVVAATDAREALASVLHSISEAFGRDPDLAYLLLFEGRRIRGGGTEIFLSKGFLDFENLIRVLIHRGKRDGTFRPVASDDAIASALLGATEAMIRDRLMAQRTGKPVPYSDDEIGSVFLALIAGLGQGSRSEASPTS